MFLIADTGGGHRASAQAIAEAIHFLHPDGYETHIEDIWQNQTPQPICKMPKAYRWMVGPGLPLWRLLWRTLTLPTLRRHLLAAVEAPVKRRLIAYYRAVEPDVVVSLHPLLNHIGRSCLRHAGFSAPFATVITDPITFHPIWIDAQVDRCFVSTMRARAQAIRLGMAAAKIAVYGQPVSIKFTHAPLEKRTLRQQLGLHPTRPPILLLGGGEGTGRLFAIARRIAQNAPGVQLLIVTGRNCALRHKLAAVAWEVPTQIYGFVENMHELMHAAELVVTKAGPGTISEALTAGLPMILSHFIPGQESGNVAYIERNGAGVFAQHPQEIAQLVAQWTTCHSSTLATLRANALRLAQPRASLLIAQALCHLAQPKFGLAPPPHGGLDAHSLVLAGSDARDGATPSVPCHPSPPQNRPQYPAALL